jgi:hypothetical protein
LQKRRRLLVQLRDPRRQPKSGNEMVLALAIAFSFIVMALKDSEVG